MPTEKVLTTSCDPEIEHVLYDHNEIVPFFEDVCLKMVYLTKPGVKGRLIGVQACEKDGTNIENGLIVYLQDGIWKRMKHLNPDRLGFIEKDAEGRIKIGS